ncbi:SIR2 family protein [Flavobacterium sp. CS20]|uniref:SIR2 family protein n=1 Tax=Flavobacterium sp. CS20 TaxID=2775246 RepID=UPI001B3A3A26|nr:SIR2 family protein [Flavobacterium sp. CS20]QTY27816.1 SIR2 family protein [Flavobacterium sp. CS20]
MKNKALLIGNDINNATESYSWQDLINGLLDYAKIERGLNQKNKPFPMLYEEIYLNSAKKYKTSERRLKKYIASQTRNMKPNELHKAILDLGIENIITTNYDLSFEKSADLDLKKCRNKGFIKESLYSVFRYHQTNKHKVWHIHGSQIAPNSITLGYEHYSGFLQQMRNYVATGTKGNYSKKDFLPMAKRIKSEDVKYESWIDLFFTHDIYILGLNLDFVEMHLWWLLTYRARVMVEKRFPINNKIVYFYPSKYEKNSRHKLEMFKVNGVETIPEKLHGNYKLKYYERIINRIKNGI